MTDEGTAEPEGNALGEWGTSQKNYRKPNSPVYGIEILAEVVKQTPASLGRTKLLVSTCWQGARVW